jgi:hypothetical protein
VLAERLTLCQIGEFSVCCRAVWLDVGYIFLVSGKFRILYYLFSIKGITMKKLFALLALFAFAGNAVAELKPNPPKAPRAAGANKYENSGKVLDVIDTSMYTYMQVSGDKGTVWLAASKTNVKKGQSISYPAGVVMTNFASKSLNRTFDSIVFLDKVEVLKK